MSTFEYVVLIAAICGVIMVIGGISLLWRGAIKLESTPHSALTIEFRKQLRLSTQVPGLAFFIVGLGFVVLALYFSKPSAVMPIDVQGEVINVRVPVSVGVSTKWHLDSFSSGKIQGRIYPDLSTLVVDISAPGYVPITIPIEIKPGVQQRALIGKRELEKKIEEISARPDRIRAVDFAVPSVQKPAGFGVPQ